MPARPRKPPGLRFAGALALHATALAVPAAESPDAAYDLGEIVVTGRQSTTEEMATLREVTEEDIRQRSARTLADSINLLPGVDVRVGGDGTPRVDVRGLRTRHVKLLINGIPFNSTYDGQFDPTLIPTEQIARIKLVTGTSSEMYGDGALGAAINIITKAGSPEFKTRFLGEGGSWGHLRLTGSVSGGTGNSTAFLSVSHQGYDAFDLPAGFEPTPVQPAGARVNSGRQRTNLYTGVTYRPAETLELGSTFNFTTGSHGIPPSVIDDSADPFANRPRYDRVDDESAYYGQVSAAYTPDDRWIHRAWAYLSVLDQELNRYADASGTSIDNPHTRGTFDNRTTSRTFGLHHQTTYVHDYGGTLSFMVEAREEQFQQDCTVRDVPPTAQARPAVSHAVAADADGAGSTTLDFNRTTTNGHGATTASGARDPIARLTLADRPNGGIDFTLTNLAGENYGAGTYLSRLYLLADSSVDLSGWNFSPASDSQASFGPASFGQVINSADGYPYRIGLNFQRPGGDSGGARPLLQGKTAHWSFDKGSVAQLLSQPARNGNGQPMWAALGIRGADAKGFWGDSGVDITGQGAVNRVYVQAPAEGYADDSGATSGSGSGGGGSGGTGSPGGGSGSGSSGGLNDGGGGGVSVEAPPPGRNCGGGDGTGNGTGNGAGAVGYFPGVSFGLRQLNRQQALGVVNSAAELTFSPFRDAEVLLGYGYHWLVREDSSQIPGDYSFNAGLSYRLTPELRLRGGASRKIRTPSIRQLYDVASGNPNLGFETAYIYETGLGYEFSQSTSLGITGFLNNVFDFIERDPVSGQYLNYQHYRFQGLEFTAETRLFSSLRLRAGYTLMDSKDLSAGTGKDQIQYVPAHKVALDAHYEIGAGFSADVFYWYFSNQYYYARRAPFQKAELAPYGLLNTKLSFLLPGEKQNFTFYIGVENLLDSEYQQSYGLPQPGRFIYGGIEAAFF